MRNRKEEKKILLHKNSGFNLTFNEFLLKKNKMKDERRITHTYTQAKKSWDKKRNLNIAKMIDQ